MHTHWSGLESQDSNAESFACSYNQVLQLLTTQILVARPGTVRYLARPGTAGCETGFQRISIQLGLSLFDDTTNVTSPCMAS